MWCTNASVGSLECAGYDHRVHMVTEVLASPKLPHLNGVAGENYVSNEPQDVDLTTRSTAQFAGAAGLWSRTHMRNERWSTSLGHVLAQVSCAIAKSNFAAVTQEESEKCAQLRRIGLGDLLLEVSYHGLSPTSSGNHPLVPPADKLMIR